MGHSPTATTTCIRLSCPAVTSWVVRSSRTATAYSPFALWTCRIGNIAAAAASKPSVIVCIAPIFKSGNIPSGSTGTAFRNSWITVRSDRARTTTTTTSVPPNYGKECACSTRPTLPVKSITR